MKKRVREINDREKYENLIDEYVQSGFELPPLIEVVVVQI